ncbi:MAG: hypothetical protein AABX66_03610 [Nanoarchaeota archaeon]
MDVYFFAPKTGTLKGRYFIVGINNFSYKGDLTAHPVLSDWEDRYVAIHSSKALEALELKSNGSYKKTLSLKNQERLEFYQLAKFFMKKKHHKDFVRRYKDVSCLVENEPVVTSLRFWQVNGNL